MRISTGLYFQRAINAMTEQQSALSKTQMQLATGKRMLTAADDPAAASRVLGLNKVLETVNQYQKNAERLTARLEHEEAAVDSVVNLLQRAKVLAVQGNNGALSATDKEAIATEIYQLVDGMMGLANTRDSDGEYIFGGFQTRATPFTRPALGTFSYVGDQGQRSLQISADRQVADSDNGFAMFVDVDTGPYAEVTGIAAATFTAIADGDLTINGINVGAIPAAADADERASQIYDAINAVADITNVQAEMVTPSTVRLVSSAGDIAISAASLGDTGLTTATTAATTSKRSVMDTLYQLANTLDNDLAVDRYIGDIRLAMEHVTTRQTIIGARLNTVDAQVEVNASVKLLYEANLSTEQDLDYAEAIGRFDRQMLALQAAQQAYVKVQGLSLFNYI
ncbi:Flagellar hook-associated protein FlgL [hydrothermal vent metagenome]|uniref:Flagellar hook-associated protein FlgL n=1 Tax=hydrothermal vent metagenome TaxID=652676 RepID=A0A3B1B451_9ZZZZ